MARPTKARISSGPAERLTANKTVVFHLAPTGGFDFLPGAFSKQAQIKIESAYCKGINSELQHFTGTTLLGVRVKGVYNCPESSKGYGEIELVDRPAS